MSWPRKLRNDQTLNRFSSWHSAKTAMALCLRYKKILMTRKRNGALSGDPSSGVSEGSCNSISGNLGNVGELKREKRSSELCNKIHLRMKLPYYVKRILRHRRQKLKSTRTEEYQNPATCIVWIQSLQKMESYELEDELGELMCRWILNIRAYCRKRDT